MDRLEEAVIATTKPYEWYLDENSYNDALEMFNAAIGSDNLDYIKEKLDGIYELLKTNILGNDVQYVDMAEDAAEFDDEI